MANLEHYTSQLEKVNCKQEVKPIIDEAFQDESLSEKDIQSLKDYAQDIYDTFDYKDFERDEAEKHLIDDYLTDDELGLTQI